MNKTPLFSLLTLLFLLGGLPQLAAQLRSDIHIGMQAEGGTAEQRDFFLENFIGETKAAGYTFEENLLAANYTLKLEITKRKIIYDDGTEEDPPPNEKQFLLSIRLMENEDNSEIVYFDFPFTELEEMYEYNLYLLYRALANIALTRATAEQEPVVDWRNKWLYIGLYGAWTPRLYEGDGVSGHIGSIGGGLGLELHFLDFLSFEAGADYAEDWVKVSDMTGIQYRGRLLEFPAMLKVVLMPSRYYMLEPYAGVQINIPLNTEIKPPLLSVLGGFQYGIKAGPGAVFADIRIIIDLGKSEIDAEQLLFQRYALKLAVGYKLGFFPRKR